MKQKQLSILLIFLVSFFCIALKGDKIKNILIIGDSISIGYTPFLEKALASEAKVSHNQGNGGSTQRGIQNIEAWLNNTEWDIILFNFGLHDLVYKDKDNKYDVINGMISVPLKEYEMNLDAIAGKLKETTAKLYFVNTTMVPENSAGRKTEDPSKYNEVALNVMKRNGIEIIDLYGASLSIHPQNSKPGNVHYTPEGYEQLADFILKAINNTLR